MTDLKKLKQLVKLMVDNDLVELDIEGENDKVKLKRKIGNDIQFVNAQQAMSPMPTASPLVPAAPAPAVNPPAVTTPEPAAQDENLLEITSPMVGSFYTASSPDAKDFITIGDSVTESSVVCIVEAMKVFNEIKAEVKGTVVKRLVENGQAVEFGQPLFLVKPD